MENSRWFLYELKPFACIALSSAVIMNTTVGAEVKLLSVFLLFAGLEILRKRLSYRKLIGK